MQKSAGNKAEEYANYIMENVPTSAILCQLAEECSELSQAALKLVRVIDGVNPTTITKQTAIENLWEEIADVNVCLFCLREFINDKTFLNVEIWKREKIERWAKRLAKIGKS